MIPPSGRNGGFTHPYYQILNLYFSTDEEGPSEGTSTEGTPTDPDDKEDGDGEDDEDGFGFITEAPQTSDRYGECLMPVTPAMDPELSPQSGMRFGKTKTRVFKDQGFL